MTFKRLPWLLLLFAMLVNAGYSQRQFGFDNRKPSGQPYLSPAESIKRFKLAPGYEISVFAAEPDVINPIAFTIDERGRVWVVENFEYPRRTPKGKKPRDRITILEDTNGDGKADKRTVWAEGKTLPVGWDLASGIEVGYGGVFLGAAPYLFHLRDTNGDGKCDKQHILLKGFGSQDTHETLNTLQWGPDGQLYGLHGVFTQSKIDGIRMNAAVWRYDYPNKKFEIFAEGTSNPWGMDFDRNGNCFLTCCVIPHLFHMVPGGTYKRQAGSSFNPYAYGLLPEICDHIHHRESGWAHAGLIYMDGDHVPEAYRGSLIMGSIHGCSVKRDTLRPNGSTYIAGHAKDFLVSGDKNFRPINMRWGPDGSIYLIDWHDINPCHQAPPDSWDKTYGRIYKISRTASKKTTSSSKTTKLDEFNTSNGLTLANLLNNNNPFVYRTALRLLWERKPKDAVKLLRHQALDHEMLRSLWALYGMGEFDAKLGQHLLSDKNEWTRMWAVRLLGEPGNVSKEVLQQLTAMAKTDKSAPVRLQLASTAQRLTKQDVLPLLHNLMTHKKDEKDPYIPLMIWLAYEPRLTSNKSSALEWLQRHAPGNPLATTEIVPRTMRRLVATGNPQDLAACLQFLATVSDTAVRRSALGGLLTAFKDRQTKPPAVWRRVYAELLKDGDGQVRQLAERLAVHFRDPQAIARAVAVAQDAGKSATERIDAIRDIELSRPDQGLGVLMKLVLNDANLDVRVEACRALAPYPSDVVTENLFPVWKKLPQPLRAEAVNLLSSRRGWSRDLLGAMEKEIVARTELTDTHILRMRTFKDSSINQQIESVWGKFRATPEKLAKLIDKMRDALYEARGDYERGRKVFTAQCAKCHKFEGEGGNVGPNLDGAARDIEYLLANVLDPNRVIGKPYFVHFVELKNGRVETGLLHAENDQTITLKAEKDVLKTIDRKDIKGKIVSLPKSLMPEGLANNMSIDDFRDLISYVMAHPFLTNVAVAGPLVGAKATAIVDPDRKWTHPIVGPPGRIPLPAAKQSAVAYVKADVFAAKTLQTRLQLGAAHPVTVWINGKKVYSGRPGLKSATPDSASAVVELVKGTNRVVIRVEYGGTEAALYARFLDPHRVLRNRGTAKSQAKKDKATLGHHVFRALVANDFKLMQPYLMTEDRWRIVAKKIGADGLTQKQLKAAADRSLRNGKLSFRSLREILTKKGFDWKNATIKAITVRDNYNSDRKIPYSLLDKRLKLDILLVIRSGNMEYDLQLDDCFLIDGKRYLGDGIR